MTKNFRLMLHQDNDDKNNIKQNNIMKARVRGNGKKGTISRQGEVEAQG